MLRSFSKLGSYGTFSSPTGQVAPRYLRKTPVCSPPPRFMPNNGVQLGARFGPTPQQPTLVAPPISRDRHPADHNGHSCNTNRFRPHRAHRRVVFFLLLAACVGLAVAGSQVARATPQCASSLGDINQDGKVGVADVQCGILTVLWELSGRSQSPPQCLGGPPTLADVNCSGQVEIPDVLVTIQVALGMPLDLAIDGNANACPDSCEISTPFCATAADGTPCPTDACTLVALCFSQSCTPILVADCSDGQLCTEDLCDPALGCFHTNLSGTINTTAPCVDSVECVNGTVMAANAKNCDDSIPCTVDDCNPALGCTHTPTDALCVAGVPCVTAFCDPALSCQYAADSFLCNDSNPCTDDICDPALGCVHSPQPDTVCDDGVACTLDSCVMPSGCQHQPVPSLCTDGVLCTADLCDPSAGCLSVPMDSVCEDNIGCTTDQCQWGLGCSNIFSAAACNDGIDCTADQCTAAGCSHLPQLAFCDDGYDCTDDLCDAATGCFYAPNAVVCDDGNACTTASVCAAADCVGFNPKNCDDANVCTADACDPIAGCVHTPAPGGCDADNNQCTTDTCVSGVCALQGPKACTTQSKCVQLMSCNPTVGCFGIPNTSTAAGLFETVFGANGLDRAKALASMADQSYAVAGEFVDTSCNPILVPSCPPPVRSRVARVTDTGTTVFNQTYQYSEVGPVPKWNTMATAVTEAVGSGIWVAGTVNSMVSVAFLGAGDAWFAKLSSAGVLAFQKRISSTTSGKFLLPLDIEATADGGVVAVGIEGVQGGPAGVANQSAWFAKVNSLGAVVWQKTVSFPGANLNLRSLAIGPNGTFYAVGNRTWPGGLILGDLLWVQFDENGNNVASSYYQTATDVAGYAIASAAAGGFVVGGQLGLADYVPWLAHFGAPGQPPTWTQTFTTANYGSARIVALAPSPSGTIAVGISNQDQNARILLHADAYGNEMTRFYKLGSGKNSTAVVGLAVPSPDRLVSAGWHLTGGTTAEQFTLAKSDAFGHINCFDAGVCEPLTSADCNDGDPSTWSYCHNLYGCTHVPLSKSVPKTIVSVSPPQWSTDAPANAAIDVQFVGAAPPPTPNDVYLHSSRHGNLTISATQLSQPKPDQWTITPPMPWGAGDIVQVGVVPPTATTHWNWLFAAETAPATGTFGGAPSPFGAPTEATHMAALGDLDGDSDLDLVAANGGLVTADRRNRYYRNDGGIFTFAGFFDAGQIDTRRVVLADFNNDGVLDVFFANAYSVDQVYLNDGTGKFPSGVSLGDPNSPTDSAAAADFDGDGDMDIAVGFEHSLGLSPRLYLNSGTGLNFVHTDFGDNKTNIGCLLPADFDGDGRIDLFVGWNNGQDRIYWNTGTGFDALNVADVGDPASQTVACAVLDYNNDRLPDVAVGSTPDGNAAVQVFKNNGLALAAADVYAVPLADVTGLESADLNGDHYWDLIVHDGDSMAILYGEDPEFVPGPKYTAVDPAKSGSLSAVAADDIDSDGDTDLVVTSLDNTDIIPNLILWNGGATTAITGGFTMPSPIQPSPPGNVAVAGWLQGSITPQTTVTVMVLHPTTGATVSVPVLVNASAKTFAAVSPFMVTKGLYWFFLEITDPSGSFSAMTPIQVTDPKTVQAGMLHHFRISVSGTPQNALEAGQPVDFLVEAVTAADERILNFVTDTTTPVWFKTTGTAVSIQNLVFTQADEGKKLVPGVIFSQSGAQWIAAGLPNLDAFTGQLTVWIQPGPAALLTYVQPFGSEIAAGVPIEHHVVFSLADALGNPVVPNPGLATAPTVDVVLTAGAFVKGGTNTTVPLDLGGSGVVPPFSVPAGISAMDVVLMAAGGQIVVPITFAVDAGTPALVGLQIANVLPDGLDLVLALGDPAPQAMSIFVDQNKKTTVSGGITSNSNVVVPIKGLSENTSFLFAVQTNSPGLAPTVSTITAATTLTDPTEVDLVVTALNPATLYVQVGAPANLGDDYTAAWVERSPDPQFPVGSTHVFEPIVHAPGLAFADSIPSPLLGQPLYYRLRYTNRLGVPTPYVTVGPYQTLPALELKVTHPATFLVPSDGSSTPAVIEAVLSLNGNPVANAPTRLEKVGGLAPLQSPIVLSDLTAVPPDVDAESVVRTTNALGTAEFGLAAGVDIHADLPAGKDTFRVVAQVSQNGTIYEVASAPFPIHSDGGTFVFHLLELDYPAPKFGGGTQPAETPLAVSGTMTATDWCTWQKHKVDPPLCGPIPIELDGYTTTLTVAMGTLLPPQAPPVDRTYTATVFLQNLTNPHLVPTIAGNKAGATTFTLHSNADIVPAGGVKLPISFANVSSDYQLGVIVTTDPPAGSGIHILVNQFGVKQSANGPSTETERVAGLQVLAGTTQQGWAGTASTTGAMPLKPLAVRAFDVGGTPVANVPIVFRSILHSDSQLADRSGRGTFQARPLDPQTFENAGFVKRLGAVAGVALTATADTEDSLTQAAGTGSVGVWVGGEGSATGTYQGFRFGPCLPDVKTQLQSGSPRVGHRVVWAGRTGSIDRFLVIGGVHPSTQKTLPSEWVYVETKPDGSISGVSRFDVALSGGSSTWLHRIGHAAVPVRSAVGQAGVLVWGGSGSGPLAVVLWPAATGTAVTLQDALGNGETMQKTTDQLLVLPAGSVAKGWSFGSAQPPNPTSVYSGRILLVASNSSSGATQLMAFPFSTAPGAPLLDSQPIVDLEKALAKVLPPAPQHMALASAGGAVPTDQRVFLVAANGFEAAAVPLKYLQSPNPGVKPINSPVSLPLPGPIAHLVPVVRHRAAGAGASSWVMESQASWGTSTKTPPDPPVVCGVMALGETWSATFDASDPIQQGKVFPADRTAAWTVFPDDGVVGQPIPLRRATAVDTSGTTAVTQRPPASLFVMDPASFGGALLDTARVGFLPSVAPPWDIAAVNAQLATEKLVSSSFAVTDDNGIAYSWTPVLPPNPGVYSVIATPADGRFDLRALWMLSGDEQCPIDMFLGEIPVVVWDPPPDMGPWWLPPPPNPGGDKLEDALDEKSSGLCGAVAFCKTQKRSALQIADPNPNKARDYPGKRFDLPHCPPVTMVGASQKDKLPPQCYARLKSQPGQWKPIVNQNLADKQSLMTVAEIRRVAGKKGMARPVGLHLAQCYGRTTATVNPEDFEVDLTMTIEAQVGPGQPPIFAGPEVLPLGDGKGKAWVKHIRSHDAYTLAIWGLEGDIKCVRWTYFPEEPSDVPLNMHVRMWQEVDKFIDESKNPPVTEPALTFMADPTIGIFDSWVWAALGTPRKVGVAPKDTTTDAGKPYLGYPGATVSGIVYPPKPFPLEGGSHYEGHAIYWPNTIFDLKGYLFVAQDNGPDYFTPCKTAGSVPECIQAAAAATKPTPEQELTRIDRRICTDPGRANPYLVELAGPKGYQRLFLLQYRADRLSVVREDGTAPMSWTSDTANGVPITSIVDWVEVGKPVAFKVFGAYPSADCEDAKVTLRWIDTDEFGNMITSAHCEAATVWGFTAQVYHTAEPSDDWAVAEKIGPNGIPDAPVTTIPVVGQPLPNGVLVDGCRTQKSIPTALEKASDHPSGVPKYDNVTTRTPLDIFVQGPADETALVHVDTHHTLVDVMAAPNRLPPDGMWFDPLVTRVRMPGDSTAHLFVRGNHRSQVPCGERVHLTLEPLECKAKTSYAVVWDNPLCPKGPPQPPPNPADTVTDTSTVVTGVKVPPPPELRLCEVEIPMTVAEVRAQAVEAITKTDGHSYGPEQDNDLLVLGVDDDAKDELDVRIVGPGAVALSDSWGKFQPSASPGTNQCVVASRADLETEPFADPRADIDPPDADNVGMILSFGGWFATLSPTDVSTEIDDGGTKVKLTLPGHEADPLYGDAESWTTAKLELWVNGTETEDDDVVLGNLDHVSTLHVAPTPALTSSPPLLDHLAQRLLLVLATVGSGKPAWSSTGEITDSISGEFADVSPLVGRTALMEGSAWDNLLLKNGWALTFQSVSDIAKNLWFRLVVQSPQAVVKGSGAKPVVGAMRTKKAGEVVNGVVATAHATAASLHHKGQHVCLSSPNTVGHVNYYMDGPPGTPPVPVTYKAGDTLLEKASDVILDESSYSTNLYTWSDPFLTVYPNTIGEYRSRMWMTHLGAIEPATTGWDPADVSQMLPELVMDDEPSNESLVVPSEGSSASSEASWFGISLSPVPMGPVGMLEGRVAEPDPGFRIHPGAAAPLFALQDAWVCGDSALNVIYEFPSATPLPGAPNCFPMHRYAGGLFQTFLVMGIQQEITVLPSISAFLSLPDPEPEFGTPMSCWADVDLFVTKYDQGPNCLRVKYGDGKVSPLITTGPTGKKLYGYDDDVGDPVQLDRGDLGLSRVDLFIEGRGFPFVHLRTYRGNGWADTSQGRLWDFAYNTRLRVMPNGDVELLEGDKQRREVLEWEAATAKFSTPDQYFLRLTKMNDGADNAYRLLDADGMVTLFDAEGNLTRRQDRFGNAMEFQYNDPNHPGRLTTVVDTMGRPIQYTYYEDDDPKVGRRGRLWQLQDFVGRSVTYEYDEWGRLVAATGPEVTTSFGNDFPDGKTEAYTYIDSPNLLKHNRLHTIVRPREVADSSDTPTFVFEYDDQGRVVAQQWGYPNQVITYSYAADSLPATATHSAAVKRTTVVDRNGNTTDYWFSDLGEVVRQVEHSAEGDRITDLVLNAWNEATKVTSPEGDWVEYVYDDGWVQLPGGEWVEDPRLRAQLLSETRHPGPRGGDQAELTTEFIYEPFFGHPCVTLDPRVAASGNPVLYARRNYFDWEEGDNRKQLAELLFPHLDSTPGTGAGHQYVSALMERMKQRGMALGVGPTDVVVDADLIVGTDLNGDGETSGAVGNLVRSLDGRVALDSTLQGLLNTTATELVETSAYYHNRFGQRTGIMNTQGRMVSLVYHAAAAPAGPGSEIAVEADASGGYLHKTIVDEPKTDNHVVVGRWKNGAWVDEPLGVPTVTPGDEPSATPVQAETVYALDKLGRVIAETDPVGATTVYERNALGQVVAITRPQPYGTTTRYYYDANDNRVAIETPRFRPKIDGSARVIVEDSPPFANLVVDAQTLATTKVFYEYDLLDRLIAEKVESTEPNGPESYLVSTFGYDGNDNLTEIADPKGTKTVRTWDAFDRVDSETVAIGTPDASTLGYGWDLADNLVAIVDGEGAVTELGYDGYDRRTVMVDPIGTMVHWTMDPVGNTVEERVEFSAGQSGPWNLAKRTTMSFDARGQMRTRTEHVIGAGGTTEAPLVWEFGYDASRQLIAQISDNGGVWTMAYDGLGRQVGQEDPIGNTDTWEWDAASRMTAHTTVEVSTLAGVGADQYRDEWAYDTWGRLTRWTDNLLAVEHWGYDANDQMTHHTDRLGDTETTTYDAAGRTIREAADLRDPVTGQVTDAIETSMVLDAHGQPLAVVDPTGKVTSRTYDAKGRVVTEEWAGGEVISYTYDHEDREIVRVDAMGTAVATVRDARGLPLEVTAVPANAGGIVWTQAGQQRTLASSQGFELEWDPLGRLVEARDRGTAADVSDDIVVTRQMDSLGRIVSESTDVDGDPLAVAAQWTHANRRTALAYPSGLTTQVQFDALDRPVSMQWSQAGVPESAEWTWMGAGRKLTGTVGGVEVVDHRDPNNPAQSGFDGVGRIVYRKFGAGILEIGRDAEGLPRTEATLNTPAVANTWLQGQWSRYDGAQRLVSAGAGALGPSNPKMTPTLAGDVRLQTVQRVVPSAGAPGSVEYTWSLDGAGNWTSVDKDGVAVTHTTGDDHELLAIGGVPMDHYANGWMAGAPHGDTAGLGVTYHLDVWGRLREVRLAGTDQVVGQYRYDALGRRVTRWADVDADGVGDVNVRIVYDGDTVIEQIDTSGIVRTTLYDPAGGDALRHTVASAAGGTQTYILGQNDTGSTLVVMTAAGAPVVHVRYTPYGEPRVYSAAGMPLELSSISDLIEAFPLFQGQLWDRESGLWQFGVRYLHSGLGRFVSRDPLSFLDSPNPYEAFLSNPKIYGDSTGAFVIKQLTEAEELRLQGHGDEAKVKLGLAGVKASDLFTGGSAGATTVGTYNTIETAYRKFGPLVRKWAGGTTPSGTDVWSALRDTVDELPDIGGIPISAAVHGLMDTAEMGKTLVEVFQGKKTVGDLLAEGGTKLWESSKRAPIVGSILSGGENFVKGILAYSDGCQSIGRQRNRDAFFDFLEAFDELATLEAGGKLAGGAGAAKYAKMPKPPTGARPAARAAANARPQTKAGSRGRPPLRIEPNPGKGRPSRHPVRPGRVAEPVH